MIQVGQRVRFNPFSSIKDPVERIRASTKGTVVWINEPHKWFSVLYGNNQRTSFKFCDIGDSVYICK